MPNELKVKPFPGVQYVAAKSIATNATEQSLRAAQYELDVALHDLRSCSDFGAGRMRESSAPTETVPLSPEAHRIMCRMVDEWVAANWRRKTELEREIGQVILARWRNYG
jgi:hypothetical protein